jgi:hypothetical protein
MFCCTKKIKLAGIGACMRKVIDLKSLLILFPPFLLAACTHHGDVLLNAKDVQFFNTKEIFSPSPLVTKLNVSGLAFHGSLAVREITKTEEGDGCTILVHLVAAQQGLSGSFHYELSLPSKVNVVYFGEDKTVIWKRK